MSPHQPPEEASAPWHSPGCTLELVLPARRWEGPKSQTELRDLLISGLAEAKVCREAGDCQLSLLESLNVQNLNFQQRCEKEH